MISEEEFDKVTLMAFPKTRLRRTRQSETIRELVRETRLEPGDFVMPYFVRPGKRVMRPIVSMPGQFQWSRDLLVKEAKDTHKTGIPAVLLFGIPEKKDAQGSGAYDPKGIIPQAVQALKDAVPDLLVITDLCFCEYTSHGHCGIIRREGKSWSLDNDATLDLIGRTASVYAQAGADVIAPSGMTDGAVKIIRGTLDQEGFSRTLIMGYSAKYASSFYGPFRDAAESPPKFGDRSTYQMDPANALEALQEVAQDLEEGADIVMVKPALAYLDVIRQVKDRFDVPLAAYNVSGEYAMVKAAAKAGWIDEQKVVREILLGIKRAGADILISYHARDVARDIS